jgi:hypothetical protein
MRIRKLNHAREYAPSFGSLAFTTSESERALVSLPAMLLTLAQFFSREAASLLTDGQPRHTHNL